MGDGAGTATLMQSSAQARVLVYLLSLVRPQQSQVVPPVQGLGPNPAGGVQGPSPRGGTEDGHQEVSGEAVTVLSPVVGKYTGPLQMVELVGPPA